MCQYIPEDNLDDISMSLYNSNYFTTVGYVSNKMSQKELLHEKKQFAATVEKPDYTEPLKIAKLLQLETWPACKNRAKCQVPTVWFKPDIALVVEEVQVDEGDGDGDGGMVVVVMVVFMVMVVVIEVVVMAMMMMMMMEV